MKLTTRLFAASIVAVMLSGCGGPSDFTPTQGMTPADIFAGACQECHGENGGGKFGFLLKLAGTDDPQEEIAEKIKEGGSIMPSFPNLNDQDRIAVAAYVKTL